MRSRKVVKIFRPFRATVEEKITGKKAISGSAESVTSIYSTVGYTHGKKEKREKERDREKSTTKCTVEPMFRRMLSQKHFKYSNHSNNVKENNVKPAINNSWKNFFILILFLSTPRIELRN
jgi:hypothetical protein